MESLCVSKMKSWLLLLMMMMMVGGIEGGCIEEERKALLQIKTSLIQYPYDVLDVDRYHILPSWVDDGSNIGGECCDWERVNCNTTTGHVTNLSLSNIVTNMVYVTKNWALNVSVFLHFKELASLNLSRNRLDDGIVNTGLGRLSSLKKLEILDLSRNSITNKTFPSLGALTSLRVLNLGYNHLEGYFPALALKKLETLDLSNNRITNETFLSLGALTSLRVLNLGYNHLEGYFPALALENLETLDISENHMEGFEQVSLLKKLKVLNLGGNKFNESFITSLSALPMLKSLDLSDNGLSGRPFPAEELAHLTNLEELDLRYNDFNGAPSIQECTRLSRLKKLKSITLGYNYFNKSIISCLSALPSLKTFDLSSSLWSLGGSFPIKELSQLPRDLEVLLLSRNHFNGTLPMEALASHFHHLEVLDLSFNNFVGSIPPTIQELSSLRVVSFAYNKLNGSLREHGLCELNNLTELDLSHNMFDGTLPHCFNRLSSLKLLDISSNSFTGTLTPSPIANLTSLEYIDFGNNTFKGPFSLSSLSNNTKLVVVQSVCNNKFEVETEEPPGWIPMFQLEVLVLSGCNMNRPNRSVVPRFLLHQRMLQILDLSDNSLVGQFPNWLIENNTMLGALVLKKNSFSGIIHMPLHMNANMSWLDVSENHMNGTIPGDIQKFLPNLGYLNLSSNSLHDVIPSSIGDLRWLHGLDLSDNDLSGEVPKGLLSNFSSLFVLKLSKNRLHGQVLSGNLSLGYIERLHLDNNCFTGKIGNGNINIPYLTRLDIGNNSFTGMIPHWISNMSDLSQLVLRNNSLEGRFPCGKTPFSFLDISENSFSGPIPSCLNFQEMKHLHLGSNRFTGSIPNVFKNLTRVLTLDIGTNSLSGKIPEFLGNLSDLRILILRKNNFTGSIPKQLCQLSYASLIDLSSNSLSGSIPSCLHNIIKPFYPVFIGEMSQLLGYEWYHYESVLNTGSFVSSSLWEYVEIPDEVQFTTKTLSYLYKGRLLDLMVGLDLSCNGLTGEIPKELGLLTQIHSLNLSHNQLSGPIPVTFSNLEMIESLDLSSNTLTGEVPPQLIQLHYLSSFNVSYNNLSGRLPDMKPQFSTFTKESYEGNPLLCGPPLEKKCTTTSQETDPSAKEGNDKWYDIDMVSFYGSCGATWVVFLLGFGAVLYINPYWRRRWLDFVEECMYTCYYFFDDCVRKLRKLFRK